MSSNSNISVAVRVRPLMANECGIDNSRKLVNVIDSATLVFNPISAPKAISNKKRASLNYAFDHVFGPDSTQEEVFNKTAEPLVSRVLSGYNQTLFAYGATGCGKTHTITGSKEDPGIIVRTLRHLFDSIDREQHSKVDISLSYLEVYNENIKDLISNNYGLELREDDSKVVVSGLSKHTPSNEEEVMSLILRGNQNRSTGFTHANATSSRSHAILQIFIRKSEKLPGQQSRILESTLSIIDLAGSEVFYLIS